MRRGGSGYTLIELVVAMALFVMLLAMFMTGVGSFLTLNSIDRQETALQQNFRFAIDTLSNDARQATAITVPSGGTGNLYLDESIDFTTQDANGVQHAIRYFTKQQGTNYVLVRTTDGGPNQPVTEEIPQLLKVYFIKSGREVFIMMVGKLANSGRINTVVLTSLVFARNMGT